MKVHFNKLLPGEHERLSTTSEELGEAVQAIGKILRHGFESFYEDGRTNREQLAIEMADVEWCFQRLKEHGDISIAIFDTRLTSRDHRNNFLHHEDER